MIETHFILLLKGVLMLKGCKTKNEQSNYHNGPTIATGLFGEKPIHHEKVDRMIRPTSGDGSTH